MKNIGAIFLSLIAFYSGRCSLSFAIADLQTSGSHIGLLWLIPGLLITAGAGYTAFKLYHEQWPEDPDMPQIAPEADDTDDPTR